jgi:MFS family permease
VTPAETGQLAYRRLFRAHLTALLGTGIAVVGLALLAFDIAGDDGGVVLATALTIKVLAYVFVAPFAAAMTGRLRKGPLLIGLDLLRAGAILAVPFATDIVHLYAAVFVFSAASAAFTPTYQALLPTLLPDADDYARALSKSRIASELENAVSPVVASALLVALTTRGLFFAAMALFLISAAFVVAARPPEMTVAPRGRLLTRLLLGPRLLLTAPGLRGLAPLHLAAAAGVAMVTVNTVVFVQGDLGRDPRAAVAALAVFGFGSVAGALAVPALLGRFGERTTSLAGAGLVVLALAGGMAFGSYASLLALWAVLGLGVALALTPAPAVVRRHLADENRALGYGALFALANATLAVAYPAAGWLGAELAPRTAFAVAAALAAVAWLVALRAWPRAVTAGIAG